MFSFRVVFFCLVTTGWSFDISSLRESLINSIKKSRKLTGYERIANKNNLVLLRL